MSEFKTGDRVQFLPPSPEKKIMIYGGRQLGKLFCTVAYAGQSALLEGNQIYQVSDKLTDGIAKAGKPFPLISAEFLKKPKIKNRFKLVESKKGKKK